MARWTASAKWAEGPALDGQRDMPLAISLTEWLGSAADQLRAPHTAPQTLEQGRCIGDAMTVSVADELQAAQMTDNGAYPERAAALCAAQQTLC